MSLNYINILEEEYIVCISRAHANPPYWFKAVLNTSLLHLMWNIKCNISGKVYPQKALSISDLKHCENNHRPPGNTLSPEEIVVLFVLPTSGGNLLQYERLRQRQRTNDCTTESVHSLNNLKKKEEERPLPKELYIVSSCPLVMDVCLWLVPPRNPHYISFLIIYQFISGDFYVNFLPLLL